MTRFRKILLSLYLCMGLMISACNEDKKQPQGQTQDKKTDTLEKDDGTKKKVDDKKVEPKLGDKVVLDEGLEFGFSSVKSFTVEPVDYFVYIFRIDPTKRKIKIVSFQEDKSLYKTPKEEREESHAQIVINGGNFFDHDKPNLADGLLVLDGKKISDINPKLSGVFTIQEGVPSIIETDQFKLEDLKPDASAIQGHPRVVDRGGKIGIDKPDPKTTKDKRQMRTVLCIKPDKSLAILITDPKKSGLYLYEIGQVAVSEGCDIALNLDGGPASSISTDEYPKETRFHQLDFPAQQGWIHPNLIVIE